MKIILALSALVALTHTLPLGTSAPTTPVLSARQHAQNAVEALIEPTRPISYYKPQIIPLDGSDKPKIIPLDGSDKSLIIPLDGKYTPKSSPLSSAVNIAEGIKILLGHHKRKASASPDIFGSWIGNGIWKSQAPTTSRLINMGIQAGIATKAAKGRKRGIEPVEDALGAGAGTVFEETEAM